MPKARIVVTDCITNPRLRAAYPFNRVVTVKPCSAERVGNATLIGATPGEVVAHRSGGIAVLLIRGATPEAAVAAVSRIPDPVLIIVHEGPAPEELCEAAKARGWQSGGACTLKQVSEGLASVVIMDATNEPGHREIAYVGTYEAKVRAVRPARAKRKGAKADPA